MLLKNEYLAAVWMFLGRVSVLALGGGGQCFLTERTRVYKWLCLVHAGAAAANIHVLEGAPLVCGTCLFPRWSR